MARLQQAGLLACLLLLASCGGASDEPRDAGSPASVSIVAPENGATVESTFSVQLAAEGLAIEPAGAAVEGAGHFHLMVDADCLPPGETIPADETHVHLADGASDTELTLAAGERTLCLQAGDGLHTALAPTDEITVTVAGGGEQAGEGEALEDWEGTYEGSVVWDCGPAGARRGRLSADVVVFTWPDGLATLDARHTVTGSCAGPGGALTSRIQIGSGERTADGFRFPSEVWGVPGSFTLEVDGGIATGRLTGPVPGPGRIAVDFDLECTFGCP